VQPRYLELVSRGPKRSSLSWAFWRGCGAIVVLSGFAYGTLVSGMYKNGVTAPRVEPVVALGITGGLALAALAVLWRWERRDRVRQH